MLLLVCQRSCSSRPSSWFSLDEDEDEEGDDAKADGHRTHNEQVRSQGLEDQILLGQDVVSCSGNNSHGTHLSTERSDTTRHRRGAVPSKLTQLGVSGG
jgi:hypothetical protein